MNSIPKFIFTLCVSVGILSPSLGQTQSSQNEELGDASSVQPSDDTGAVLDHTDFDRPDENSVGYMNWKTKTLGGQQFWTDIRNVSDWRVQHNSETGHFRVLDPSNTRHAWGNQLHCDQVLDKLIVDGKARPCQGKVVIVLHGLIRTKSSMQTLADYLKSEGEFTTINFQYASTRNRVGEHAAALKHLIDQLGPRVTEINFVGHSLGNLVVRRYLGDNVNDQTGIQGDPRIKRMVMIGPPNQGSRMARILKSSFLFKTIAGVSGAQLSVSWDQLQPTLATPNFEFGIIAGGQETDQNFSNFVLRGKDDFTVSVNEAKLAGAHDFWVKPLFHSTMVYQPKVLQATLKFIQHGYFETPESRRPLTSDVGPSNSGRSDG